MPCYMVYIPGVTCQLPPKFGTSRPPWYGLLGSSPFRSATKRIILKAGEGRALVDQAGFSFTHGDNQMRRKR